MLEADSQHGKGAFCGSRRANVSEERVARGCRIISAFYVHLRLNVCTEIVASMLGVILGN